MRTKWINRVWGLEQFIVSIWVKCYCHLGGRGTKRYFSLLHKCAWGPKRKPRALHISSQTRFLDVILWFIAHVFEPRWHSISVFTNWGPIPLSCLRHNIVTQWCRGKQNRFVCLLRDNDHDEEESRNPQGSQKTLHSPWAPPVLTVASATAQSPHCPQTQLLRVSEEAQTPASTYIVLNQAILLFPIQSQGGRSTGSGTVLP